MPPAFAKKKRSDVCRSRRSDLLTRGLLFSQGSRPGFLGPNSPCSHCLLTWSATVRRRHSDHLSGQLCPKSAETPKPTAAVMSKEGRKRLTTKSHRRKMATAGRLRGTLPRESTFPTLTSYENIITVTI